ncbi:MAG: CRTAC1 family protein [Rhodocyclaceae bacterium]|nr:CRTAC1 family protein [Rhodocyclaceae bacterium]MBX3669588.1 CRTAC1 family protein [Rhodocyclaceae bacterium]
MIASLAGFAKRHAVRVLTLGVIAALYGLARLPQAAPDERAGLAARFHFTQTMLAEPARADMHKVRKVHPQLQRISAWISSVGAAVALADVDGDGLPNDYCLVDPRTDKVSVAPVPGSPARYAPLTLDPAPLPLDAATMAPMGCLPGDFNEDGRTDLLVYYWGRTPVLFLGEADGRAPHFRPVELVEAPAADGGRWFTNAATSADLDGDGHVDLVIGNYFQDGARILDTQASADTYMQDSMSRAYNGGKTHFFLWTRSAQGVKFVEADPGLDDRITHGWSLAAGAQDLDGDLLPELYLGHDFGPDRLLHNRSTPGHLKFALLQGQRDFFTPASKVLGRDSYKGMGVDFADLNGDGIADIYVSNIAAEYALEESHFMFVSSGDTADMMRGVAPYKDKSEPLGLSRSDWSWEARLADFDNDGFPEALQATGFVRGDINRWPELHELAMGNDGLLQHPQAWLRAQPGDDLSGNAVNPFFVRGAQGRFVDISAELDLATPQVRRGIATGDTDGDGALDYIVANQWEASYFFHNDCPQCGSFLGLHLLLPAAGDGPGQTVAVDGHPQRNRPASPAIGAQAKLRLPDGRVLVGQVDGGNGHSGKRSQDLHFGLGKLPATTPLAVELAWRDRSGQIQRASLTLKPGWHSVYLGGSVARPLYADARAPDAVQAAAGRK